MAKVTFRKNRAGVLLKHLDEGHNHCLDADIAAVRPNLSEEAVEEAQLLLKNNVEARKVPSCAWYSYCRGISYT